MDTAFAAPIATVIGALVGMAAVIIGGLLTVSHQRRLERDKSENTRADALAKERATAVQQLTISVASALHSMCWLAWLAAARPDRLTQGRIDKYDDEQHAMLPKIMGYLSTTAALDAALYQMLRPQVDDIFSLDAKIGQIGLLFKDNPDAAAKGLADCFPTLTALERQLPQSLGDIIATRIRTPPGTE